MSLTRWKNIHMETLALLMSMLSRWTTWRGEARVGEGRSGKTLDKQGKKKDVDGHSGAVLWLLSPPLSTSRMVRNGILCCNLIQKSGSSPLLRCFGALDHYIMTGLSLRKYNKIWRNRNFTIFYWDFKESFPPPSATFSKILLS